MGNTQSAPSIDINPRIRYFEPMMKEVRQKYPGLAESVVVDIPGLQALCAALCKIIYRPEPDFEHQLNIAKHQCKFPIQSYAYFDESEFPMDCTVSYAVVSTPKYLVVVVRGSSTTEDWMANINANTRADGGIEGHSGFIERSKHIPWNCYSRIAKEKGKTLVVTGHSHGGAVVEAGVRVNAIENVVAVTFGQPTAMKTTKRLGKGSAFIRHYSVVDPVNFATAMLKFPFPFADDVIYIKHARNAGVFSLEVGNITEDWKSINGGSFEWENISKVVSNIATVIQSPTVAGGIEALRMAHNMIAAATDSLEAHLSYLDLASIGGTHNEVNADRVTSFYVPQTNSDLTVSKIANESFLVSVELRASYKSLLDHCEVFAKPLNTSPIRCELKCLGDIDEIDNSGEMVYVRKNDFIVTIPNLTMDQMDFDVFCVQKSTHLGVTLDLFNIWVIGHAGSGKTSLLGALQLYQKHPDGNFGEGINQCLDTHAGRQVAAPEDRNEESIIRGLRVTEKTGLVSQSNCAMSIIQDMVRELPACSIFVLRCDQTLPTRPQEDISNTVLDIYKQLNRMIGAMNGICGGDIPDVKSRIIFVVTGLGCYRDDSLDEETFVVGEDGETYEDKLAQKLYQVYMEIFKEADIKPLPSIDDFYFVNSRISIRKRDEGFLASRMVGVQELYSDIITLNFMGSLRRSLSAERRHDLSGASTQDNVNSSGFRSNRAQTESRSTWRYNLLTYFSTENLTAGATLVGLIAGVLLFLKR